MRFSTTGELNVLLYISLCFSTDLKCVVVQDLIVKWKSFYQIKSTALYGATKPFTLVCGDTEYCLVGKDSVHNVR